MAWLDPTTWLERLIWEAVRAGVAADVLLLLWRGREIVVSAVDRHRQGCARCCRRARRRAIRRGVINSGRGSG